MLLTYTKCCDTGPYVLFRQLKVGDHIAVKGGDTGVEYYHHGIFLGHEKGVANVNGWNKHDAKPKLYNLQKFTYRMRRPLIRINYPSDKCLPPEIVVKKCKNFIENPEQFGQFSMFTNNCEHFATLCKTGTPYSMTSKNMIYQLLVRNPVFYSKFIICMSIKAFKQMPFNSFPYIQRLTEAGFFWLLEKLC